MFTLLLGVPIPTYVTVNSDRSFSIELASPPISWLVRRAAGVGAPPKTPSKFILPAFDSFIKSDMLLSCSGGFIGQITVKHAYEIAALKSTDTVFKGVPMELMVQRVIAECHKHYIQVVKEIDAIAYKQFLTDRMETVKREISEIEKEHADKLLGK